jgi:hypothetical protein
MSNGKVRQIIKDMRDNSPLEFAEAVKFDCDNRSNPIEGSTASEIFIYRGRVLLGSADLDRDAEIEMAKKKWQQISIGDFCGGLCNT